MIIIITIGIQAGSPLYQKRDNMNASVFRPPSLAERVFRAPSTTASNVSTITIPSTNGGDTVNTNVNVYRPNVSVNTTKQTAETPQQQQSQQTQPKKNDNQQQQHTTLRLVILKT